MDVQDGKGLSPWAPKDPPPAEEKTYAKLLFFTRYVVPALIALTGVIVMIVVEDRQVAFEIGGMFLGAAIAVVLLNLFFRMGVSGDKDRDREEEARVYFDRHGHWPDEKPGSSA